MSLPARPASTKGRSGVPGDLGTRNMDNPPCPASSESLRASKVMRSLREAWVIQVLLPRNCQPPCAVRSGAGADRSEIRSDVGFGEGRGRQNLAGGDERQPALTLFVRAAAWIHSAAISERVPSEPAAIQARLNSSETTHIASFPIPKPPNFGSMQTPNTPMSAISETTSSGRSAYPARCHLCACGAMRRAAKVRSCSQKASSVGSARHSSGRIPSAKSSARRARGRATWTLGDQRFDGRRCLQHAGRIGAMPISAGRTNSVWLDRAARPKSCAKYSPQPMSATSCSASLKR